MRDILLIVIVGAGSITALFRPVFGVLFFAWLAFFNPQTYMWGTSQSLPFSQIAAVCTICGYLLSSETKRIPKHREFWLLLSLWGIFGISTVFAIFPKEALPKFIFVSKIFVMIVLTILCVNNEQRLNLLLKVIALSLGVYAVKVGVFVIVSGGSYNVYGPDPSFLATNNAIGLALVINIPLLIYLLKIEANIWLRRAIKIMIFLSYPAVVCTYSRGAWIGLAIITALIALKSRRKPLLIAATMVALVILPVLHQVVPQRITNRYDDLVNYKEEVSAESRFWNWEFCKRVGLAHPFTGGGFSLYSTELYQKYYPEFVERWGPDRVWSCHSVWFTILAEHGVVGLILWVWIIGSCFLTLNQIRSFGLDHAEGLWIVYLTDSLKVAFIGFMGVGTFFDAAYFDMFYYLIAIIVILREVVNRLPLEKRPYIAVENYKQEVWKDGGRKAYPFAN